MDYYKLCESELRDYEDLQFAVQTLPDEIKTERNRLQSIRSCLNGLGGIYTSNRHSSEARLLDSIARLEVFEGNYERTRRHCERVEAALSRLTEYERAIVEEAYIHFNPDWLETLCSRFHFARSKIYGDRRKGVRKFAMSYFGLDDAHCAELLKRFDADESD